MSNRDLPSSYTTLSLEEDPDQSAKKVHCRSVSGKLYSCNSNLKAKVLVG